MNDLSKGIVRPYATLFAVALVIALLARLGLWGMDFSGTISYDYISASDVPILSVITSILTGSTFVAFLFVAALTLGISTAGVVLYAALYLRDSNGGALGRGRALRAFLCGWVTALVGLICALIVVSGILSAVQVHSMSSKLPDLPILIVAIVGFAAFLGTLLGAASLVVCACIARAKAAGKGFGRNLIVATLICGAVVTVLTIGTFANINTSAISLPALGAWFAADLLINIAMMIVATMLIDRAIKRTAE